ncbi:MAG: FRG domain-containing protein [Solirubrobacteraceae bacterium]
MFGADQPWLWRGQANSSFSLEPGMHTRVRRYATLDDDHVESFTDGLLSAARAAALDNHEGTHLPDLALLALLQHHSAATPLLDVTLDPIVGLYMAVVSPHPADDDVDGVLFAIRRPEETIDDFDSRPFSAVYQSRLRRQVALYSAPDVSERLRIQRGHFLLGPLSTTDSRVTIPLTLDSSPRIQDTWMMKRMKKRGSRGPVPPATSDIAVFRITASFKGSLRAWLEARSGLTRDFVYPTAWHQPHLERFAASHGRAADFLTYIGSVGILHAVRPALVSASPGAVSRHGRT